MHLMHVNIYASEKKTVRVIKIFGEGISVVLSNSSAFS